MEMGTSERAPIAGPGPSRIESASGALLVGVGAAVVVVAAWVLLTWATGKTYHLAPLVVAAAPGFVLGLDARRSGSTVALAAALGALTAFAGWAIIELAGFDLGSTFFSGQPGGVTGEVVTAAAVGLAIGAYAGLRPR